MRPPAFFFFSSRRRHTRSLRDWSSDVCSSDLEQLQRLADVVVAVLAALLDEDRLVDAGVLERPQRAPQVRSEERRVGKDGTSRWGEGGEKAKKRNAGTEWRSWCRCGGAAGVSA